MSARRWSASAIAAAWIVAGCSESSSPAGPGQTTLPGFDTASPLSLEGALATDAFEAPSLRGGKVFQLGWQDGSALVRSWGSGSAWQVAARGISLPTSYMYHDAEGDAMATLSIDGTWTCPLRVVGPGGTWIPTTSTAWKEVVSMSKGRVAWIDYRHNPSGGINSEVYVAHPDSASERRLTTDDLYQTGVELGGDWAVWVEYVHGDRANIRWMDLATGQTRLLDPQTTHQDNPHVADGWVVWEDYRSVTPADTADIDVWGWSPATGAVPLVAAPGYQGAVSLSEGRMVWEDYAPGASVPQIRGKAIVGADTATRTLVARDGSGAFQGKPSLEGTGLTWLVASGSTMEVRRAGWAKP